eukprot:TRINITY_DN10094_c0_g1_i2.p1 TRINITY_DN10094_c0_g1~~TRINITY_DN10094_c0_g1_i2.p1  ORF type:complete len:230 (-),score=11.57 TRINITY_DN10094_c0_g1_i2:357-1046(-)
MFKVQQIFCSQSGTGYPSSNRKHTFIKQNNFKCLFGRVKTHKQRQKYRLKVSLSYQKVETEEQIENLQVQFLGEKNGLYEMQGSLRTDVAADRIYNLLVDYEGLSEVYRTIDSSTFTTASDGKIILNQVCRWEFLLLSGTFETVFLMNEFKDDYKLVFEAIKSPFMKSMTGSWKILDDKDGGTIVQHVLAVQPLLSPPPILGDYTQRIFESQVRGILEDLQASLTSLRE